MNKKLTAALIAAGTLPFAAQALELSVDYNPSFSLGGSLIDDTTLNATLDTETGVLALSSDRSSTVIPALADNDDILSREASNALVVNLLTGESGFVRTTGFAASDAGVIGDLDDDNEFAVYAITRAITPNGDGTFDYASAFEANVSAGNLDFAASSDLAAFADVSSVADIRAQIGRAHV